MSKLGDEIRALKKTCAICDDPATCIFAKGFYCVTHNPKELFKNKGPGTVKETEDALTLKEIRKGNYFDMYNNKIEKHKRKFKNG